MKRNLKKIIAFSVSVLMIMVYLPVLSLAAEAPVIALDTVFEAEDCLLDGGAAVINDAKAEGGKAVVFNKLSGEASNRSTITGTEPVELSFKVNIGEEDTYSIWIRYYTDNGGTDSFFWAVDGAAPTMGSPAQGSAYQWLELKSGILDEGEHEIKLWRREAGFRVDEVKVMSYVIDYDTYTSTYAAAPYTSGEVEYPKLIDSSYINYMPKFEDGDNVIFIGDSITHGDYGGWYHM